MSPSKLQEMQYNSSNCDLKVRVKYYCTYQRWNGLEHVHVEDVWRIKFNRGAFCWSTLCDEEALMKRRALSFRPLLQSRRCRKECRGLQLCLTAWLVDRADCVRQES